MQSKSQLNNGWGKKKSTNRDRPEVIQMTEWSSTLEQLLLMYSRCLEKKKNGGKHEPVKEKHGGYKKDPNGTSKIKILYLR